MNKNLITFAILSLSSATAFAHTGVRDNVLEGVATYTGYTITHGCADNASGESSGTPGVDGNTSQKDVIAQSAVFPTNFNTAIIGPVNSNNYFTSTYKTADLIASTGPLGTGGVISSVDVIGGKDSFYNVLPSPVPVAVTNNSGQVAAISFNKNDAKSPWAVLTDTKFTSALSVSYVAPSVFPEAYIKRDSTGLFRGYDSWGSVLPEGGGTVGVSNFKVTAPVLNPDSCFKGIKIYTAVINYCSTENAKKDTNNDRYDVWAGFGIDHKPAVVGGAGTLVNGDPITATTVFTNQHLMPNAATAANNADGTPPIFWSTITVNRVSPLSSGCANDPNNGLYLGIAPSTEDIDKYLPMAVKTKSHPGNIGKKFDPNSDPSKY